MIWRRYVTESYVRVTCPSVDRSGTMATVHGTRVGEFATGLNSSCDSLGELHVRIVCCRVVTVVFLVGDSALLVGGTVLYSVGTS